MSLAPVRSWSSHRCGRGHRTDAVVVIAPVRAWSLPQRTMRLYRRVDDLQSADHHFREVIDLNGDSAVFVYGTLMRGQCRDYVWDDHDVRLCKPASMVGLLYDLGAYPGLVQENFAGEPNRPSAKVHGEYFVVAEPERLLRQLDEIEGDDGTSGSLYRRRLVRVTLDPENGLNSGGASPGVVADAWTYIYNRSVRGFRRIDGGDWRSRPR